MFKFCNTLSKGNKNININIYFQGNGNLSCSFYDSHIKSTLLFLKSQLHVKFDPTLVCFTPARFLSRFEMTLLMGFWRREGAHPLGLLWAHQVGLYNPTAAVNGAAPPQIPCTYFQSTISSCFTKRKCFHSVPNKDVEHITYFAKINSVEQINNNKTKLRVSQKS